MLRKIIEVLFRKKIDIELLANRVVDETMLCNSCLQFIEDSGNYKKKSQYRMNEHDHKEKMKELKNQFIMLQSNMIIADEVIRTKKNMIKKYKKIAHDLNNELMKKKIKHLKQKEVQKNDKIN